MDVKRSPTMKVNAKNVETALTAGVVFTLTRDLSGVSKMFARRPVGAHFVSQGLTDSGYCVKFLNTFTGRVDQIMAEDWVLKYVRVIPA